MNSAITKLGQVLQLHTFVRPISVNASFIRYAQVIDEAKPLSPRMQEFRQKLRETTSIGQLDELSEEHPHREKEPLQTWPNNTNPTTGEVGGPLGPEPTRYGDWERKGKVSDF